MDSMSEHNCVAAAHVPKGVAWVLLQVVDCNGHAGRFHVVWIMRLTSWRCQPCWARFFGRARKIRLTLLGRLSKPSLLEARDGSGSTAEASRGETLP